MPRFDLITIAKFWTFADQPEEGCWNWKGPFNANGYGVLYPYKQFRKPIYAHRFRWMLEHGEIPANFFCDLYGVHRSTIRKVAKRISFSGYQNQGA